ncbi:MAG TPA: hypothetical protein VJ725_25850 [Thermoanaerobaculia bacterium]|nr:hypothetical protein [Thermoanaerobaculia bacterium]
MKKIIQFLCTAFVLLTASAGGAEITQTEQGRILSKLHTPEEFQGVLIRWPSAPGWFLTDVVFGIYDGKLTFAKYTAISPEGIPYTHDKRTQVDWVIEDTTNFPGTVLLGVGPNEYLKLDNFTVGMRSDGQMVVDSLKGWDSRGKPISTDVDIEGAKANGLCGPPVLVGVCDDTFCLGTCNVDLGEEDPCDCTAFTGFCSNTARLLCDPGTCSGACELVGGACGCFGFSSTICSATSSSSSATITAQNNTIGIQNVRTLIAQNANVVIPSYVVGTKDPIVVNAFKIDPNKNAHVVVAATDTSGAVKNCDPVITLLVRKKGKDTKETVSGLSHIENRITVTNGTPGLKNLLARVNGVDFRILGMQEGEVRKLDISRAMLPGSKNTVVLMATGKAGSSATIVIHN